MPLTRPITTLALTSVALLAGSPALAQVTDYLIIGESVVDYAGDVVTNQNAVSGSATIDEGTPGSPELTAFEVDVEWNQVFDAESVTGCPGSTVTMDSQQTMQPALPQSGSGDSDTAISWGSLTGWSQTGHLFCTTQGCPISGCVPFFGFEGTGPPLLLASASFDSDPWQFVGPGSPKIAFLTDPLRITDLPPLSNLLTQDIDLIGVQSNLVSPTPTTFCVSGLSTGADWAWQIDAEGINDVTNPGAGSTEIDLSQAFVDSIEDAGTPPAAASANVVPGYPACFTITYTQPFQLFVGPPGSTPCLVSGNPTGCNFNPLLIERRFIHDVPIPTLALVGGAASVLLGTGWTIRRRYSR